MSAIVERTTGGGRVIQIRRRAMPGGAVVCLVVLGLTLTSCSSAALMGAAPPDTASDRFAILGGEANQIPDPPEAQSRLRRINGAPSDSGGFESDDDFEISLHYKLMGQVNLIRYGLDRLSDRAFFDSGDVPGPSRAVESSCRTSKRRLSGRPGERPYTSARKSSSSSARRGLHSAGEVTRVPLAVRRGSGRV